MIGNNFNECNENSKKSIGLLVINPTCKLYI